MDESFAEHAHMHNSKPADGAISPIFQNWVTYLPVFRVYLCLPLFNRVYLRLPLFTRVYLCLTLFTHASLPHVY